MADANVSPILQSLINDKGTCCQKRHMSHVEQVQLSFFMSDFPQYLLVNVDRW
jgi:hypothetical protein